MEWVNNLFANEDESDLGSRNGRASSSSHPLDNIKQDADLEDSNDNHFATFPKMTIHNGFQGNGGMELPSLVQPNGYQDQMNGFPNSFPGQAGFLNMAGAEPKSTGNQYAMFRNAADHYLKQNATAISRFTSRFPPQPAGGGNMGVGNGGDIFTGEGDKQLSFASEFENESQWKEFYQRINRNGGMKNIRCFPYCGQKHYSTGFCGETIVLKVRTNSQDGQIFAYAEIGLKEVSNEVSRRKTRVGTPDSASETSNGDTSVRVGSILSGPEISNRIRTRECPTALWWRGELKESKEVFVGNQAGVSGSREKLLAFEFNRDKRGWHYGWLSNKYIADSLHIVRAYIFQPVSEDHLEGHERLVRGETLFRCVHVAESPAFKIFSRKPKKSKPSGSVRSESMAGNSEIASLSSSHFDKTYFLKKSAKALGEFNHFMSLATTGYFSNTEDVGGIKAHDNDEDASVLEEERQKRLKVDMFQILQNLLFFTQEDFSPIEESGVDAEEDLEIIQRKKELTALRAFAAFLLSDEEELTGQIQERIESGVANQPSKTAIRKRKRAPSVVDGNIIVEAVKQKFDSFLAAYNMDFEQLVKGGPLTGFLQSLESAKVQSQSSGQQTASSPLLKPRANEIFAAIDIKETAITGESEGGKSLEKVKKELFSNNTAFLVAGISHFLQEFEGQWVSSDETQKVYDRMYTEMKIPYALRKCYLAQTASCIIHYNPPDARPPARKGARKSKGIKIEKEAPIESVLWQYSPKLFSRGVVKYLFDGVMRKWPLTSPLISTKFDAIAHRAYVSEDGQMRKILCLEHIYRNFKMLRVMSLGRDNEIRGTIKLFQKGVGIEANYIEWTELDRDEILLTRA